MPHSTSKFKLETVELLMKKFPQSCKVLDVGPGSGIYGKLLRPWFRTIDCLEIYNPYIEKYSLRDIYDKVLCGTLSGFVRSHSMSSYDIVILGDVLEHMPIADAQLSLIALYNADCFVVVAVPYEYEQGPEEGNPFEEHVQDDLTPEVMVERYADLRLLLGDDTMGVYVFDKHLKRLRVDYRIRSDDPKLRDMIPDGVVMEFLMDWGRKQVWLRGMKDWAAHAVEIDHPKSENQDVDSGLGNIVL